MVDSYRLGERRYGQLIEGCRSLHGPYAVSSRPMRVSGLQLICPNEPGPAAWYGPWCWSGWAWKYRPVTLVTLQGPNKSVKTSHNYYYKHRGRYKQQLSGQKIFTRSTSDGWSNYSRWGNLMWHRPIKSNGFTDLFATYTAALAKNASQWAVQPAKLPLPLWLSGHPYNAWFLGPTRLIHSVVL